jgi:hypothetical protein
MEKECRDCQQIKPVDQFYFNRKHGVHSSYCKPCHIIRATNRIRAKRAEHHRSVAKWKAKHRAEYRDRQRRYNHQWYHRRKTDPEWFARLRERRRTYQRERYHSDPAYREMRRIKAAAYYRRRYHGQ